MSWRPGLLGLVAACSSVDTDAPGDDMPTCIVRIEDVGFTTERFVYPLVAPGQAASASNYRDDVIATRWTYTYDNDGRIIVEELDCCGGTPNGPDGIVDQVTRYEHTATSTIVTLDGSSTSTEAAVDADDRITNLAHYTDAQPIGSTDYLLTADGAIAREERDAVDPDLGPYTQINTYLYEEGRVIESGFSDTRLDDMVHSAFFTYESQPDRLVMTKSWANGAGATRWIFSYDAEGRPTRSEEDERADGGSELVVDFEYDDGAVVARLSRGGVVKRVYSATSECGYIPSVRSVPWSGTRPGARWTPQSANIPAPF